jgi:uncharacterized protein
VLSESDDLSWYARKAAKAAAPVAPGAEDDPARPERVRALIKELRLRGIRGSGESMTLFTRRLPPGCRLCLQGRGSNLYVTGHCTRDCFFCFNEKPRKDELVVHGVPVKAPEEAAAIVERYGLTSVGISGGEPLLFPERVLRVVSALRALPSRPRVDLYTNGDLLDHGVLRALKEAGLSAIRVNAVARDFDLEPVRLARKHFEEVAVEVPVIPGQSELLRRMVLRLDAMGVPFLNIHELFLCSENSERVRAEGHEARAERPRHLLWAPTAASGEAALELLLFALNHAKTLSVYYCSCGTQDLISRNGLRRRRLLGIPPGA